VYFIRDSTSFIYNLQYIYLKIYKGLLFAVPGFIGWIIPYFLYRRAIGKQTEKLAPLIEQKYDEIYEICEKGNKLLH